MYPSGKPNLVQNWVSWLNQQYGQGWFALNGFYKLTDNQNKDLGITVKAFWNQNTGEIKTFDARKFL